MKKGFVLYFVPVSRNVGVMYVVAGLQYQMICILLMLTHEQS